MRRSVVLLYVHSRYMASSIRKAWLAATINQQQITLMRSMSCEFMDFLMSKNMFLMTNSFEIFFLFKWSLCDELLAFKSIDNWSNVKLLHIIHLNSLAHTKTNPLFFIISDVMGPE